MPDYARARRFEGPAESLSSLPLSSSQYVAEKWRMLPSCLRLMRLHVESFDYFVNTEIKKVVGAAPNRIIRSEVDPNFFLQYEDVYVGEPIIDDGHFETRNTIPHECRLRDTTYSAPIFVDVKYMKGGEVTEKIGVEIGRIPIMVRSSKCVLSESDGGSVYNNQQKQIDDAKKKKITARFERLKECPHDPGGYFIVKGVEKVILMQEQLSKNRVIVERDAKGNIAATITSSTHERKSRCSIVVKPNGYAKRVYLRHNTLGDDIPIIIVLKAMGIQSDQEIAELVAGDDNPQIEQIFHSSMEESGSTRVRTQNQALLYIGECIRNKQTAADQAHGASASYRSARRPARPEDEAREVLAKVVLSHVPVHDYDFTAKRIFIAYITRRVLAAELDHNLLDDKDYYGNKRLELAGQLLSVLFEDLFKRFNTDLKRSAELVLQKPNRTKPFDIVESTTFRQDTITQGFIHAISTGNWVLKRFKMDRSGVTQVLSRLSYVSAVGMTTRVNSQFEKTRKTSGPRALQPSQWGMLCPADTPEGETCGLVKNLALLAHVTTDTEVDQVLQICIDLGVEQLGVLGGRDLTRNIGSGYLVFLNGLVVGGTAQPKHLATTLRRMRRSGRIGRFVSVYAHDAHRAIYLACDGGRVCRPLIVAPKGKSRLTRAVLNKALHKATNKRANSVGNIRNYNNKDAAAKAKQAAADLAKQSSADLGASGALAYLLESGVVEYVDVNEENNCLIALDERALTPQHTHLEIDPVTILGVVSGLVAFPHHNQSPRNTYQCAMGKQAMGIVASNHYSRMDSLLYSLVYPQKPMVTSRVLDLIQFNELPGGCNASLAVMSYSGYDIEDAVILNKASLDRGFMRCVVMRKHFTALKRYANGLIDRSVVPPPVETFHKGADDPRYQRYGALDNDGICHVGERLYDHHIMINREVPIDMPVMSTTVSAANNTLGDGTQTTTGNAVNNNQQPQRYKPQPVAYKGSMPSIVDRVLITSNEVDTHLIKVMIRQMRRPEVGDKFASRHGQKGVCGAIVPQEDMPFSDTGVCPDLIMNPHGFPSRMTVGKIIELVAGKAGVFAGRQAYGTAFGEDHGSADRAETACQALVAHGFNYVGKDMLYSGTAGEPLKAYIFMGYVRFST
uniref:DNA-directed RNA polymerase subunit beta n=1 Tax=Aureoumbra lagunensis TaxID=44058 RepID=A0A6S8BR57_9STRA